MFNENTTDFDAFLDLSMVSLLDKKNISLDDGYIIAFFRVIASKRNVYCFGTSWSNGVTVAPNHTLIGTIGKSMHAYSNQQSTNTPCVDALFNQYLGNKSTGLFYFTGEYALKKTFKNLLDEENSEGGSGDTRTTYCIIAVDPSDGEHSVIYEEVMDTPPIDIATMSNQYSSETPTNIRRLVASQNPYIKYLLDDSTGNDIMKSAVVAPIPTLMLSKKPILASYMGPVEIDGFDVMDVDDIEDDVDVLGFILDTRKFSVMVNTLPHLIISDINHYFLWDGETLGHYTVEDIKAMFAPIVSAVSDPRKRRLQSR